MALSVPTNYYCQLTKSTAGVASGVVGKSANLTFALYKIVRGAAFAVSTVTAGGAISFSAINEINGTGLPGGYGIGVTGQDPAFDYFGAFTYTGTSTDVDLIHPPTLWSEFSMTIAAGALPQKVAGATDGVAIVGSTMAGNWLTTLGSTAPAGWLNAAAFAAGSLNGKGDWLLASGYTAPPSTSAIATYINANIASMTTFLAAVALAVENRIMDEGDGDAVLAAIVAKINSVDTDLSGLSIAAIAAANAAAILVDPTKKIGTDADNAIKLPVSAPAGYGGGLTGGQATQLTDVQTKVDALALSSGGDGSVLVTQDLGGTDTMRITLGGSGLDNVTVRAYLKTEYNAGTFTVRDETATKVDGRWARALALDPAIYIFTFTHDRVTIANHEGTVV